MTSFEFDERKTEVKPGCTNELELMQHPSDMAKFNTHKALLTNDKEMLEVRELKKHLSAG
jgi:hypothetical protein